MIRASDYMGVILGNYEYLFFVVSDSYSLYSAGPDSLMYAIQEVFAQRIGRHGAVVTSFTSDIEKNYELVMAKEWSTVVRKRLETPRDPKFLIIATDFARFSPKHDPFLLIDFAQFSGDLNTIVEVLRQVEEVITNGQNLFQWWEMKAKKERSVFRRLFKSTELKPGIWGFSFDLDKYFQWK